MRIMITKIKRSKNNDGLYLLTSDITAWLLERNNRQRRKEYQLAI